MSDITALDIAQTILIIGILYAVLSSRTDALKGRKPRQQKLILDTCALIDGRIIEIAKTGFASAELIIPQFIIHELQLLADGHDAHKRERARFGLDMVQALQAEQQLTVTLSSYSVDKSLPTDDKLVAVATKMSADLCTTDYNLNKVATIAGVRVLNVNELAKAVRPVALPGEKKHIKIVQKGSNKDQGVGYLEDGTMVVVEGAARAVGKSLDVEVSRYIQTDAGKMLFAKAIKAKAPIKKR